MAINKQDLKNEVRDITDYPSSVISDSDLDDLVAAAKREVQSQANNYDINFYDPDDLDGNRALMWTTCLFAKVKAGELDGAEYSLESLDVAPASAAGIENGRNPALWLSKANKYIGRLSKNMTEVSAFGHQGVERENRTYGSDDTGSL